MRIQTVIQDVYKTVSEKGAPWFTEELKKGLADGIARSLQEHYQDKNQRNGLRLSQMGPRCPRALWHSVHTPELAEELPPWAKLKYSYGHIIEAQTIALIKAAGHEVKGEQDVVMVDGVAGRRDLVLDGCVCDVKSCSPRHMEKIQANLLAEDDPFGYLDQLDGYTVGGLEDPLVRVKDKAYLLAVDKVLGHMVLYEHTVREENIRKRVAEAKRIIELPSPPPCECKIVKFQESGNMQLDMKASYNVFKHCCFPNLRTFLYASGPVYLTKVVRRPKPHIYEVDKHGNILPYRL